MRSASCLQRGRMRYGYDSSKRKAYSFGKKGGTGSCVIVDGCLRGGIRRRQDG